MFNILFKITAVITLILAVGFFIFGVHPKIGFAFTNVFAFSIYAMSILIMAMLILFIIPCNKK